MAVKWHMNTMPIDQIVYSSLFRLGVVDVIGWPANTAAVGTRVGRGQRAAAPAVAGEPEIPRLPRPRPPDVVPDPDARQAPVPHAQAAAGRGAGRQPAAAGDDERLAPVPAAVAHHAAATPAVADGPAATWPEPVVRDVGEQQQTTAAVQGGHFAQQPQRSRSGFPTSTATHFFAD